MERRLRAFEAAIAETAARRPFNIVGSLRISPAPPPGELRRALDGLQKKHPMLRAHLESRGDGRWFVDDEQRPIPVKALSPTTPDAWQVEMEACLSDQLDPSKGPLIRFSSLSDLDGEFTDLIFVAHHAILDGVSAQAMVDELLHRLAGSPTNSAQRTLTDSPASRYPARYRIPQALAALVGYAARELVRDASFQLRNGGVQHRVNPAARSKVLTRSLDQDASQRLIRAARRRRVSVNSALQAAGLLALARYQSDRRRQPLQSITFADLRPYLKPPLPAEQLGCAISMLRFGLILDTQSAFWDTAQKVHLLISGAATRGDKFVATHMAPAMMRFLLSQRRMRMASTALSYLGPIKLSDQYGPYQLKDVHGFVSDVDIGPAFTALAHVWRSELRWDFAYLDTDWDQEKAGAIADRLLEELRAAPD
jgi:hypothetical protein